MPNYKVTAHLPATVEISRRTTRDTLTIDVEGGEHSGKLVIARGTVEWWPNGKKVNAHRANWDAFAIICVEHFDRKRSVRASKKPKK